MASFIKPIDDYAVVIARDAAVIEYTAQSQSKKAMGADAFQASKQKVLDVLAEMIGVTADELAAVSEAA